MCSWREEGRLKHAAPVRLVGRRAASCPGSLPRCEATANSGRLRRQLLVQGIIGEALGVLLHREVQLRERTERVVARGRAWNARYRPVGRHLDDARSVLRNRVLRSLLCGSRDAAQFLLCVFREMPVFQPTWDLNS